MMAKPNYHCVEFDDCQGTQVACKHLEQSPKSVMQCNVCENMNKIKSN